ncbi:MogA/MoaB family molybdenum cofactor biosynthesis protein [Paenibacillus thermotolerans]|uniref:MogA/MoaB family molybdenum cofactor biosynthesis protein n=1 Tax=Paenibacillus thermotolerans TaxID=3027807 RepID=UPI0023679040|nr:MULTISPECIES: MogA/MoaB family molybdenum cofactor biosynthesis protein [unclassified Paenibacillus]
MQPKPKVAILTASDRGFRGERESTSALVLRELAEEELNGQIVEDRVVPDETDEVMAALIEMSDYHHADLILTTGGVGLRARDTTPEATRRVIEREAPGFAEMIRTSLRAKGRLAAQFRGTAGTRGNTLIVNLPSTPKGVSIAMLAMMKELTAALETLQGKEAEPDE